MSSLLVGRLARVIGASAVATSAYVHARLYFDGYRTIDIERVAGLNIGRAFALNAIAGAVIALALLASLVVRRVATPAALAGIAFSAATLVAYWLTRTRGLLGYSEAQWTYDAKVAVAAEVVGFLILTAYVAGAALVRFGTARGSSPSQAAEQVKRSSLTAAPVPVISTIGSASRENSDQRSSSEV